MILVDSSVWIDWLLGKDNAGTLTLDTLLEKPGRVVVCDRIVQEVVQGIRNDAHAREVQKRLTTFDCLDTGGLELALLSAQHYRNLRKKGITVRSSNDVVIATLCVQHDLGLLHNDRDFDAMEKYLGLKVA